jgi:hypothetical protein
MLEKNNTIRYAVIWAFSHLKETTANEVFTFLTEKELLPSDFTIKKAQQHIYALCSVKLIANTNKENNGMTVYKSTSKINPIVGKIGLPIVSKGYGATKRKNNPVNDIAASIDAFQESLNKLKTDSEQNLKNIQAENLRQKEAFRKIRDIINEFIK